MNDDKLAYSHLELILKWEKNEPGAFNRDMEKLGIDRDEKLLDVLEHFLESYTGLEKEMLETLLDNCKSSPIIADSTLYNDIRMYLNALSVKSTSTDIITSKRKSVMEDFSVIRAYVNKYK